MLIRIAAWTETIELDEFLSVQRDSEKIRTQNLRNERAKFRLLRPSVTLTSNRNKTK